VPVATPPTPSTPVPPADLPDPGRASDPVAIAGYDHGLHVRTRDDAFRLGVGGWVIARYEAYNTDDNREQHFVIPSVRLAVAGHAFSTIDSVLSTQPGTGSAELRDAYIDQPLPKGGMIRIGQFKPYFSHQQLVTRAEQTFAERAPTFELAGIYRDIGAAIHHEPRRREAGLELALGMFNGEGTTAPTAAGSARPLVTARIGVRSARVDANTDDDLDHGRPRLAFGIGYAGDLAHAQSEQMVHNVTVDLVFKGHGVSLAAAGFIKSLPAPTGRATKLTWHAPLGYVLVPHLLELAGRLSQIPALVGDDHIHEVVTALNIYRRGHRLKWQIEGGATHVTGDDDIDWVTRVQTQLMF